MQSLSSSVHRSENDFNKIFYKFQRLKHQARRKRLLATEPTLAIEGNPKNQDSRCTRKALNDCATGINSRRLMLTCAGRVATQTIDSAISAAVKGCVP